MALCCPNFPEGFELTLSQPQGGGQIKTPLLKSHTFRYPCMVSELCIFILTGCYLFFSTGLAVRTTMNATITSQYCGVVSRFADQVRFLYHIRNQINPFPVLYFVLNFLSLYRKESNFIKEILISSGL